MTRSRPGPARAEVVTTVVVVLLAAAAVFALWPRDSGGSASSAARAPVESTAVAVPDAELAAPRRAAELEPCPGPPAPLPAGAGVSGDPDTPAGLLAGVSVPCLGAPGAVDLGAALAGRPVLLNMWASWCAPCRAELPVLASYAARPGAAVVLGVDVRDDPRAALSLLAELGVTLPSVHDPDQVLRSVLDIPPGLPVSYLVRADGTVARVDPPVPFTTVDEVDAAVRALS